MITVSDIHAVRKEFGSSPVRKLMGLLPAISDSQDDFSELKPIEPTKRHYKLALISIALVIGVSGMCYWLVPLLRNSIITSLGNLIGLITDSPAAAAMFILIANLVMVVMIVRQLTSSNSAIPQYALLEEKVFRAGSEDWNWIQRLRSNLIFGSGHLFNLIVFLAVVPGLAAGGWWFMCVYRYTYKKTNSRNAALLESGAVHAAHNRMVLYSMPVVLAAVTLYLVIFHH